MPARPFDEEWAHHRFAVRDLAIIEATPRPELQGRLHAVPDNGGIGRTLMSNLELRPAEMASEMTGGAATTTVEVLHPRTVPLGGPRAMTVRRTLPQRRRSLIGSWCFVDHYGPDAVAETGGMRVPPHPHTGLQTVSWLFTGDVEHRDSAGNHARIRPGELNLMTAGRGISHSEVSTPDTHVLHGVQLWVALPSAARFAEPGFEHYVPRPIYGDGINVRVFLGSLLESSSPVTSHSQLVGAEVTLNSGGAVRLPVAAGFEHGVLVDSGSVTMNGAALERGQLGYVAAGPDTIDLSAGGGDSARILLLGGEPLGEQIVMWWNFIGRSHEEIVEYRANWQVLIGEAPLADGGVQHQFGLPIGDPLPPLPAPALPNVTLRARE